MPNLTPFEIALLVFGAVLVAALAAILWWHLAGDRVKALIAGWMALPRESVASGGWAFFAILFGMRRICNH